MKKILKFEIEEGKTLDCKTCQFGRLFETNYGDEYVCENGLENIFDCRKYNLSTLKLIED